MYELARKYPRRHQARQDRHDAQGPRDPRAEGHAGRARPARRQPAGGAVQRDPARPRVDRDGDRPPPDVPLHRGLGGRRPEINEAAPVDRAVVRPGHEPGRLPVHVRRRAAVAQEPARQRRRRRRRRSPTASTRTATTPSTSSTTRRAPRRSSRARPTAARPRRPSARRRRSWACRTASASSSTSTTTPTAAWLLYPEGWQVGSPTADDPIYFALSGNLDRAGDRGLPSGPELGRPLRHQRRGQRLPAQAGRGAGVDPGAEPGLPELRLRVPGRPGAGPGGVRAQPAVRRVRRELRGGPGRPEVRRSASRPSRSTSRATTRTRTGIPGANFAFKYSYGDPQPVQVLAKRALGAVTAKYQINGGATRSASTSEWKGGERYKPAAVYYHVMRGTVTGTEPGDTVEVWFEGGGQRSESFTYEAVSETGNRMLVVAAEDYTGASPVQAPRPAVRCSTTSTRWPRTASPPTSTTSTSAAASRRTTSACSATTTASSGTRATTS